MTVPGWVLIGWAGLLLSGLLVIAVCALIERRMLRRGKRR